jgi:hypothetical protein
MAESCQQTKPDGNRCRATAGASGWCWFHDPDKAKHRADARRRGGRTRNRPPAVLPPDTPDAPLASVADLTTFLGVTINQVRKGLLEPKVGNCIGLLCGQLLRALEGGELEKQMDELRSEVDEIKSGRAR